MSNQLLLLLLLLRKAGSTDLRKAPLLAQECVVAQLKQHSGAGSRPNVAILATDTIALSLSLAAYTRITNSPKQSVPPLVTGAAAGN